MTGDASVEFSLRVPVESIGKAAKDIHIEVDESVRTALAKRFGLVSIDRFVADIVLSRAQKGQIIRIDGTISADIVQECIVTQEPVAARIRETVCERAGPQEALQDNAEFAFDEEDPPEPFVDDCVELGEILAQCLAVAIDPYPRLPGATSAEFEALSGNPPDEPANRPFDALAVLKGKNR